MYAIPIVPASMILVEWGSKARHFSYLSFFVPARLLFLGHTGFEFLRGSIDGIDGTALSRESSDRADAGRSPLSGSLPELHCTDNCGRLPTLGIHVSSGVLVSVRS